MNSTGQIACLLIASQQSDVVIERFFERFEEQEKADIRRAFQINQTALTRDSPEAVGRFRSTYHCDTPCYWSK